MVDDDAVSLAGRWCQAPSKLLAEKPEAGRGACHDHHIAGGHVKALAEQVHIGQNAQAAGGEPFDLRLPVLVVAGGVQCLSRNARRLELGGNVTRVLHIDRKDNRLLSRHAVQIGLDDIAHQFRFAGRFGGCLSEVARAADTQQGLVDP